ncbi:hypothetical protein NFI96_026359, partial [Prochilodus magdalenae]
QHDIPRELRRRRQGSRARALRRARSRRYKPVLHSVVMGNVRSLPSKMDELTALTRHQREYRECSVMVFTETWLTTLTPDTLVSLDGFHLIRADRMVESGKRKGGGLAVFVNDRWCNSGHITISVCRLQTQHPQALLLISGDFNHVSPSSTLSTFTQSDHNLVHLLPVYKPLVHREPAVTRTVKKWSKETEEALKDCFETTVWEELSDPNGEDIDSLTHCITDYVNFCVENTVHTKTILCFSNNKPCINPDIKALLNEKKRVFRSGDKDELKAVQRELRRKIREGKASYRRKLEEQLQRNNVNGVWKGIKTISGHKKPDSQVMGDQKWVNERNLLFNRFDHAPAPPPAQTSLLNPLSVALPTCYTPPSLTLTPSTTFSSQPPPTAPKGPQQLQTGGTDLTLERLVPTHLRSLVRPSMDPLQFAGVGVDDAVIYLLHRALSHLEKPGSTVRITSFDFSSAFNTIQPRLLKDKLEHVGLESHLSNWILDYLTNRPHSPNCHLQKFSDDSAIVGLITNEEDSEYRELIQDFVDWCLQNHLQINAGKTKELVVDFRRCRHPAPLVNIQGIDIERVDSYKYLGVHLNNKLDWSVNATALHKKGQSRLYLLRRLRSFGVQGALLRTLFDTVVASAIFYGVVCWGSSISTADRKRLNKLLKTAGSVLGSVLRPSAGGGRQEDVSQAGIHAALPQVCEGAVSK